MRLQPNIGSDRSWVWKVAADYSESPPTAETLAIRFANSESELINIFVSGNSYMNNSVSDAGQFKTAFEDAQAKNAVLLGSAPAASTEAKKDEEPETETKTEEVKAEETKAEEIPAKNEDEPRPEDAPENKATEEKEEA